MKGEQRITIIDNDFLQYLMRNQKKIDGVMLFQKMVKELNIRPIVHPYVYHQEMFSSGQAKLLVDAGHLKVIEYSDFLKDQQEKDHYNQMFCHMYKSMNGEAVLLKHTDALTYREARANLGEIHSLLLAIFCGYDMFLSNDNGSKHIVDYVAPGKQIDVYNIMDIFKIIAVHRGSLISKEEFLTLTKGDVGRKKQILEIKNNWIE